MIVRSPVFPSLGIDCVTILDKARCQGLKAAGIAFVVRYLDTLTEAERDTILGEGLGLSFCSYSAGEGWVPSAARGDLGGREAVRELGALFIPAGATVWTDLEGVSAQADAADVEAWGNSRALPIQGAGFDAGLYVGAGAGLSAEQLQALRFDRYWRSLSNVPTPSSGYSMLQLFPTTTIAGTSVDVDCVQHDWRGRLPAMVWAD